MADSTDRPNPVPLSFEVAVDASQLEPDAVDADDLIFQWQEIVDLLADLARVPAALIMRVHPDKIEVFRTSRSLDNPYEQGETAPFHRGCGLYCENVLRNRAALLVPNALADDDWKDNPDVELDMISYLGVPLLWPDGEPFGTLCILDSKENHFDPTIQACLQQLRGLVESHLALVRKNRELASALAEIKTLRGMIPICVHCKSIRSEEGYWERIEQYITHNTEAELTHGLCDACAQRHYPRTFSDDSS